MAGTHVRKRDVTKRIGGRGCPSCGGHNTDSLRTRDGSIAAQFCYNCEFKWLPCSPGCRGYSLEMDTPAGPMIRGCVGCKVPDTVARTWPEAYRAMARVLDARKLEGLT